MVCHQLVLTMLFSLCMHVCVPQVKEEDVKGAYKCVFAISNVFTPSFGFTDMTPSAVEAILAVTSPDSRSMSGDDLLAAFLVLV